MTARVRRFVSAGCWLWGLALVAWAQTAPPTWHGLTQATLHASPLQSLDVTLPHFVRQEQSGLIPVHWSMTLPPAAHSQRLPALLFPQPVQGLTVTIGNDTVYSVPASTADTLRHWYRPVLVPLPHTLLQGSSPVRVHVEQTGHLRGWYLAPVLQGELIELQVLHDRYLLISSTLPTTVNLLSMLVGVFVLSLGWRTRSATYAFGGLTLLVWGILFSLALSPVLPLSAWFAWRLLLYACTGNLIYVVLRFLAGIFHHPTPRAVDTPVLLFLQLGWVVFAWVGSRAEPWLDMVWTGGAVAVYGLGSLILVSHGWRQRQVGKVLVLGLHGALTAMLAWHDYVLQAGLLPPGWLDSMTQIENSWWLQPVYLTHLSLPVFAVISLWLLVQDHVRHGREQAAYEQSLRAQRDRITRDIHDGVGARLNLMLWRTRTAPLVASQLQDELERSIEELRFAINPQSTADQTLIEALRSLCQRSARWGQATGVEVHYEEPAQISAISAERGLHLYKAAHEGLSNALRHSQATRIDVRLTTEVEALVLVIADNGQGIAGWHTPACEDTGLRATAMGLRGMQHRMQALGGHCLIDSGRQGTRLTFMLPLIEKLIET